MKLRRRLLLRKWLLTLLLIAGCALTALAQSSVNSSHLSKSTATLTSAKSAQDDPIAKALEQAINRLAVAEEKNRLLEQQLKAKDDQLGAKDELIKLKDERIALMQANRNDQNVINTGDAVMLRACEQQLSRADLEINRLRHPGFLRSVFDVKTITGAVVGYGIGRVSK